MPGNYDDIIRGVLNSTSPTSAAAPPARVLPITQPQPGGVDDATAVADAKNKLLSFITAQRQQSADEGYWDPATNLPTPKGIRSAGFKYAGALAKGELAGEGMSYLPEVLEK